MNIFRCVLFFAHFCILGNFGFCQVSFVFNENSSGTETSRSISAFNTPLRTAATGIGGIINDYTPVLGFNPCENKIIVEDASAFKVGDTVMMIQMKGAVIDSSNTAGFGTITDYKSAGNYEFNYIKNKLGNIIELKNFLTRQYEIPSGVVQLIRVPFYQDVNIISNLSCKPWDGKTGGVLVLNTSGVITLNADIDVSGKGFRGGVDPFTNPPSLYCYENQYYYPRNPDLASEKGEGITSISDSKSFGKGALANGGGGGNSHNSGGGGGSNGGIGGLGGYCFEGGTCSTIVPFDNRGFGGVGLVYNSVANKIFLGGGGGAGQSNNPEAFQSTGGNGAGIVIIIANQLLANNNRIISNGNDGTPCGNISAGCHEGMGGGGGGGTVLLNINSYLDNISVESKGGKGADMTASSGYLRVGPGGGGGGGIVWLIDGGTPGNVTITTTGGLNGVATDSNNDPWGTTPSQAGSSLFNLVIPFDLIPFKPNIDSVRISETETSCNNFNFTGFAFTNTTPVSSWQWYFGDGGISSSQNTTHTYNLPNTYPVKLITTDINGCKDSISINVTSSLVTADAGPDTTICSNGSVILQASSSGGTQYSWSPSQYLSNSTTLNPTANPPTTTRFYFSATNSQGCVKTDSVTITVRSPSVFTIDPPVNICQNGSAQLQANGGDTYWWTPGNLTSALVTVSPQSTTPYSVLITDTVCNSSTTLSTIVTVLPLPNVIADKSNDIDCTNDFSQLVASGANNYLWNPAGTLNNPAIPNPIARPLVTTQYIVQGSDVNGCVNYDSVIVKVEAINKGQYLMSSAFTPNNDGLNDCFGLKYWGILTELDFRIYNRWGQLVFRTTDPSKCWDGYYKGIQQNPGVFVYWVKAKSGCDNGEVFRKGTVTLIR